MEIFQRCCGRFYEDDDEDPDDDWKPATKEMYDRDNIEDDKLGGYDNNDNNSCEGIVLNTET